MNSYRNTTFSTLESLRGMAALAIAVFHFSPVWAGYLAVDFFLVLSGFILSHRYLYNDTTPPTSPITFISHRLARLYPLHIYTLLTFIFVYLLANNDFPSFTDGTIFTFLQQITLTHNIGLNPNDITYNYPSWSISVEFWVNVIFIFFVTKTTKSTSLLLISSIGLFIIYTNNGHMDVHSKNFYSYINSGMIRGISVFYLGILSYRLYLYYQNNNFRKTRKEKIYISIIEALIIVGIFLVVFDRENIYSTADFFAPFLFMFAVAVFSLETGFFSTLLIKIKYLGEISYSVYLNQITVLMLNDHILEGFGIHVYLLLATYLVSLILYSHLTYQYIEKPFRKKGRNIFACIAKKCGRKDKA